ADRVMGEYPIQPVHPLIVVGLGATPGLGIRHREEEAHIQVDAWDGTPNEGGSPARANLVARTAFAVMIERLHGAYTYSMASGVVAEPRPTIGIQYLPDATTFRPRYLFEMAVSAH